MSTYDGCSEASHESLHLADDPSEGNESTTISLDLFLEFDSCLASASSQRGLARFNIAAAGLDPSRIVKLGSSVSDTLELECRVAADVLRFTYSAGTVSDASLNTLTPFSIRCRLNLGRTCLVPF